MFHCVNGSDTHNDEMCNLYIMYYAKNDQKPYFTCLSNSFPHLFNDIPADNDIPLPSDPWLDAVAAGRVHKGISSCSVQCVCSLCLALLPCTHTHPFNGPLSGTTRVTQYQKGKTNLDFSEARDSERQCISWAICKFASRSRQITTPAPYHSVFYRPDALPAAQPTASKH